MCQRATSHLCLPAAPLNEACIAFSKGSLFVYWILCTCTCVYPPKESRAIPQPRGHMAVQRVVTDVGLRTLKPLDEHRAVGSVKVVPRGGEVEGDEGGKR